MATMHTVVLTVVHDYINGFKQYMELQLKGLLVDE